MNEVCFILNPASRRGKSLSFLKELKAYLALHLPEAELVLTEAPGHATVLARKAGERGCRRLFSVGGDGTLNEVVNGVMALPVDRRPAVGVLSSGTGGDFPRRLRELAKFPKDLSWILDVKEMKIDVGSVTMGKKGADKLRYFVNIADAGIAGEVVRRVNTSRKFLGAIEYARSTISAAWSYSPPRVRLAMTLSDGSVREQEMDLLIAMAANGRYFGGGMCIAPEAELDDGRFFFMVAEAMPYLSLMFQLRQTYRNRRMRHPKLFYSEGTRMEIQALSGNLALDLDGEFLRTSRVVFEIVPQALHILVPS